MVKITLLSGRFKNRTRHFSGTKVVESFNPLVLGEDINPHNLFLGFLAHQDAWEVDYSRANPEEAQVWFLADLAARVNRALQDGRVVRFMDHEWSWQPGDNLLRLIGEVEDTIADSGFMITLESDDENGLVISTHGLE